MLKHPKPPPINAVRLYEQVYAAESLPTVVRSAAIGFGLAVSRMLAALALPLNGFLLQVNLLQCTFVTLLKELIWWISDTTFPKDATHAHILFSRHWSVHSLLPRTSSVIWREAVHPSCLRVYVRKYILPSAFAQRHEGEIAQRSCSNSGSDELTNHK